MFDALLGYNHTSFDTSFKLYLETRPQKYVQDMHNWKLSFFSWNTLLSFL